MKSRADHEHPRLFVLLLLLILSLPAQAEPDPDRLADFVARGMAQWQVPGMAVAVVSSDAVLFGETFEPQLTNPDRM